MAKKILIYLFSVIICLFLLFLYLNSNKKSIDIAVETQDVITVSILPIKYLVDNISGNKFDINVLVPPGASPETYEPTPLQLINLSKSAATFTIGLIDFEVSLIAKINGDYKAKIHSLYKGVDLIEGHCTHEHNSHPHGVDPHIWMSLRCLKVMATNIVNVLTSLYPEDAETFTNNYQVLIEYMDKLDKDIDDLLSINEVKSFLIYHPVLSYFSRDYDLKQVVVEQDGKEPSVEQLKLLVDIAKSDSIRYILYQKEFNQSVVETIASDVGAKLMEIDPLSENILNSIWLISNGLSALN